MICSAGSAPIVSSPLKPAVRAPMTPRPQIRSPPWPRHPPGRTGGDDPKLHQPGRRVIARGTNSCVVQSPQAELILPRHGYGVGVSTTFDRVRPYGACPSHVLRAMTGDFGCPPRRAQQHPSAAAIAADQNQFDQSPLCPRQDALVSPFPWNIRRYRPGRNSLSVRA